MISGHPVVSQMDAIAAALYRDLPEIPEKTYEMRGEMRTSVAHRPRLDSVEVISFPMLWGSTALGYGGMGGASMTTAQTTVVLSIGMDAACIYFGEGGRLWRSLTFQGGKQYVKSNI